MFYESGVFLTVTTCNVICNNTNVSGGGWGWGERDDVLFTVRNFLALLHHAFPYLDSDAIFTLTAFPPIPITTPFTPRFIILSFNNI